MTVFIDADGCPVVDITVSLCGKYNIDCVIICDTSHIFNVPGARTVTVEKGADSADFKLANMIGKNDIAVTQDYGLAAMCLAKGAVPISQNGLVYTDANMDELLFSRYVSKKIRMAGGRLKGPSKRTKAQDAHYIEQLEKLIQHDSSDTEPHISL